MVKLWKIISLNPLVQMAYITYQIKAQDVYFHPVKFHKSWTRLGHSKTGQDKYVSGKRIWQHYSSSSKLQGFLYNQPKIIITWFSTQFFILNTMESSNPWNSRSNTMNRVWLNLTPKTQIVFLQLLTSKHVINHHKPLINSIFITNQPLELNFITLAKTLRGIELQNYSSK